MIMDANHSSGASPFLANLPFRGVFSSTVLSSKPGDKQVYMCDHDTSPPEGQQIKTNQQDILVRSLTLTKQRGDSKSKDGAKGSRNRAAQKVSGSRASAKRTHNEMNSQQGSASRKSSEPRAKLSREREILEKEQQRSLGEILSLFAKEQRVITAEYRMMVSSMEKDLIKMEKRLEISFKRWSTLLAKIEAGASYNLFPFPISLSDQ